MNGADGDWNYDGFCLFYQEKCLGKHIPVLLSAPKWFFQGFLFAGIAGEFPKNGNLALTWIGECNEGKG